MVKIALEPQISSLENGLRVVSTDMPDVETVAVGVWVNVGSRYEHKAINGISHFLEHMAFKGTERRSARQIAIEFDNIGGILNAYTSRERTVYYAIVLKNDLAVAVDMLADIMQHSTFDTLELERERGVIIQEIAQSHDTPDDIVFDYFQDKAFPGQSVGMPILGDKEEVSSFTSEDLKQYMSEFYSAEQMVLSIAGNISHDEVRKLAEDTFTALPSKKKTVPEKGVYRGGELYVAKDLEQVHLVMGFEGVGYMDDIPYYTQQLGANILGGGMSSRLFQEVRENRGLAYSISSFGSSYVDTGTVCVYAGTTAAHVNELLEVVCQEWVAATANITEEELQRSKNQVKAGLLMSRDSARARMEEMGANVLIHNRFILMDEILEKLDTITVDMVQKSLLTCLQSSALTCAAVGDTNTMISYEKLQELLVV